MAIYKKQTEAEDVVQPLKDTTKAILGIGVATVGAGVSLTGLSVAGGLAGSLMKV